MNQYETTRKQKLEAAGYSACARIPLEMQLAAGLIAEKAGIRVHEAIALMFACVDHDLLYEKVKEVTIANSLDILRRNKDRARQNRYKDSNRKRKSLYDRAEQVV